MAGIPRSCDAMRRRSVSPPPTNRGRVVVGWVAAAAWGIHSDRLDAKHASAACSIVYLSERAPSSETLNHLSNNSDP